MGAILEFVFAAGTTIATAATLQFCSTPRDVNDSYGDEGEAARAKTKDPTEMKSLVAFGKDVKTFGSITTGLSVGAATLKTASIFQSILWPYGVVVGGAVFAIGTWLEHSWVRFVENEAIEEDLRMCEAMWHASERNWTIRCLEQLFEMKSADKACLIDKGSSH